MRRGEICALTSDDIHGNTVIVNKALARDEHGKYVIKPPKTFSSNRSIDPDFVIERLNGISGKITDYSPQGITKAFSKVLQKSGIPHFRFHDLRHYAVSIMHAMNVPDKYIMARGGWNSNYTMNNIYNHALKNKQTEFDNKISAHFNDLYTNNK
jgi:integrase